MRVPRRRFGEPAVYVGTVESAAGLEFEATRVIGLCEGVLPSQPHENPILPERVRERLEAAAPGRVLPRAADRVALQLHGLFAAVAGARGEVVLSAPRVDVARTERETSAVFIEAAAAIARPHAVTGAQAAPVPDSAALSRDFFAPAREAASAFRSAHPVSELAWLAGAAGRAPLLPPSWAAEPVLALDRVAVMRFPTGPLGPQDGVLGDGDPFPRLPGVDAERPISASALQQLLQCPRMFLMRRILGWDEPAGAPSLRELDALSFGSLLHRTVEAFYRAHGAAFVAASRSMGHWKKIAFALADGLFEEFLSEHPLVGAGVREKERERLLDALGAFLDHDRDRYRGRDRRFVGVEVAFGEDAPLQVAADGVTLHLHGFIDRLDVVDGVTLVRDLKSGKAHRKDGDESGPTPFRDVQLGVYALATRRLATQWNVPRKLAAAYVYASGRGEVEERSFRDDFGDLEKATAEWLATAGQLLAARAFPPTPDQHDCRFCPFAPVCGDDAVDRARAALEDADGPLGRFGALKLGEEEDEG
jgi:RecB family exonuclease